MGNFRQLALGSWLLASSVPVHGAIEQESKRWVPGIGDPTVFGWLTVLAYLGAGFLAACNVRHAYFRGTQATFWVIIALVSLLLAVNKQLDLQTWFTQLGRDLAVAQGWYEKRRHAQVGFILALNLGLGIALVAMRVKLAAQWREYRLTLIGMALLAGFVVARAATFHHIDGLLSLDLGGIRVNFLIETAAIAVVALGAYRWRHSWIRRT